tara:strand:- start:1084 stop:1386 length:303 start_codon:yes stop_codon:yes gene_type:complete
MNKLNLEKIENTGLTTFAHLSLKTDETTFKIQTAGMGLAIKSIHSVGELKRLLIWLDEPSGNKRENGTFEKETMTNESEIRYFAKESFEAQKQLNRIKKL